MFSRDLHSSSLIGWFTALLVMTSLLYMGSGENIDFFLSLGG